ncbi:LPD38 domain-containing protein [Lonepinella koalarum]|uniref:Phage MuF C-terminal domain-containing protein n=1 Tax=Lonepinella koalarum TaxID=53417 RepID=A0A4R1KXL8_9PAST|nr:LPD38 domain-containing protein [Lonepinella koalarum]MDH2927890.1 hypothetical protein [Lonepinella koalarum]TCK70084.1 hypothetical protein EV692_1310 [Lonepinella koalarum]TFJ90319.1 hypothetical protein E0709_02970 [Lonepinella koalarum]
MSQSTDELIRLFQNPNNPPAVNVQQAFADLYGAPNAMTAQPDTAFGLASLYAPPTVQVAPQNDIPPSAGFWGNVKDAALVVPKSATRLVSSVGGLIDPQGALRQWGDEATQYWQNLETEENRYNREQNAQRLALDKQLGGTGFTASLANFFENPLTTGGDVAESVLPGIAVGIGAAYLAPATGGVSLAAAAPMILGGVQGAGETRNEINDHIMAMPQEALDASPLYLQYLFQGHSPESARVALATSLKEHGGEVLMNGLSSAALERLGGFLPVGRAGSALNSAGGRFGREFVTETADEMAQQVTTNKAISDIDNAHSLTDNLGAAAFGGMLGGGLGGGVAYGMQRMMNSGKQETNQDDELINSLAEPQATQPAQPTDQTQAQTAVQNPPVSAVALNEQALERVLANIENESDRDDLFDELKADIQDGVIEQVAQENTRYGKLAAAYLAEVGHTDHVTDQATPTESQTAVQNPSDFSAKQSAEQAQIIPREWGLMGKTDEVDIGDNQYQPFQYEVVEADVLTPTQDKADNQFRDRNRVTSQTQIQRMAANLDPRKLGESPTMDMGAPLVAQNGNTIIAGNGRSMAIQQAYQQGKGDSYRQYLINNAGKFGIDTAQLANMKNPVLVRRLSNDVDIAQTAIRSNEQGGMQMSNLEQAKVDAQRLPSLGMFNVGENGELNNVANRQFINQFIANQSENMRNALLDGQGQLSQTGVQRLRNALLYTAYGDTDVLTRAVESTDQGAKNILNALVKVSPAVAQAKQNMANGRLGDVDISADIVRAVEVYNQLRSQGRNINEYLAQQDFVSELSPEAKSVLTIFNENHRSAKRIGEILDTYYRQAQNQGNIDQGNLFDDTPFDKVGTLEQAKVAEPETTLFSRSEIKSGQENIARGSQAMNMVIQQHSDVENAMFRQGVGWIDFIWGTVGRIRPNGKSKGAKGVSHIINKRMQADNMSREQVENFLTQELPSVINNGDITEHRVEEQSENIRIEHNGNVVHLVKEQGKNAWLLTAFESHSVNQGTGVSSSDLRTNSPTPSRAEVGADGINNIQQRQQSVNTQATQDQQTLSRILGEKTASHIEVVDRNTVQPPKGETAESLLDGNVEGWYDSTTQKIYIYSDNITANNVMSREERLAWVAWHELAHRGVDVTLGARFEDIVTRMGKHPVVERIAKTIQQERAEYGEVPFTVAVEEAVAEINAAVETGNWAELESRYNVKIGRLWKDGFGQYLRKYANVLRRVVNAILKRDPNSMAMTTQEVFDVLAGIRQGGIGSDTQGESGSGEVRYSLSEDPNSDFAKAVDAVANGENVQGYVNVGTTPDVLKMIGLPDTDVTIHGSTFKKVMQDKHNVTPETLKQLPKQINNPVAVMKSSTQENGYVVLTELTENVNGVNKPVVAALHLKQTQQGIELINIASVYGRNNSQIQRGLENDLLYWNKEKGAKFLDNLTLQLRSPLSENSSPKWTDFADTFGLQLPAYVSQNQSLSERNIKTETDLSQYQSENKSDSGVNSASKVHPELTEENYNQAKADGKTELTFEQWKQVRTPEFKRWFGDWENDPKNASKVINPRTGEPLVVYRGTPQDLGYTFKYGQSVYGGNQGFWFTPFESVAKTYAFDDVTGETGDIKAVFIKSTKPLDARELGFRATSKHFYNFFADKFGYSESNGSNKFFDITDLHAKNQDYINSNLERNGYDGFTFNDKSASGEVFIVFNPNQIKSATDNNGEFNPDNDDIRFSRKAPRKENYQRDLMVTHSLSAENIMHADKMGGLPMASLAISKQGSNIDFGEVTLIGDRNHIDPKGENKANVFGSDIYSPRYPQVSYKLNAKDQRALYQRFEDTAKLLNDKGFDWNFTGNLEQKGVSNILADSAEVQYEFLQSKGIEPNIVYEEKAHNEFADYQSVQKALSNGGIDALRSDDFLRDFAKERLAKLEEARAKQGNTTSPIVRKSTERKIAEMQDIINMSAENRAFYLNGDIKRLVKGLDPTTDVDYGRTKAALNEQITQHHYQNAFNQYVQDIVAPLDIREQLENGENPRTGETRYVEHSLENVVKKLKQNLRGGESFDYGTGSLRAKVTPQFKSVPDIQKNKSRLVDKETSEQAIEQMENDVATLGEQLGVGNEIYNLLHNAVDESIEQAFVYSSVENTPQNRQAVADMLAKLKAMPTEYFEAKAKDVTQFSDFLGAVVPENLPKNAYNVLEKAGLKIYEYDPNDTNSRAETVKQATNELDENSGGNVLFSRRPKTETLEKLRESESIHISGKEIEASSDMKQYKRNALNYGKSLRGVYTNKDTGGKVNLTRSSILEVLHHDFKNPEHLQSIAAIPQIIENAVYLDTLPNEDKAKNPEIREYDYYVAGLNIGKKDYTVRAVIATDSNGEKYYDHKLTPIEKGELIAIASRITSSRIDNNSPNDELLEFTSRVSTAENPNSSSEKGELLSTLGITTPNSESNSPFSAIDDKRLLQILQEDNQQEADNANNDIRYSRRQSAANLAQKGQATQEAGWFDDVRGRNFAGLRERWNTLIGKVDEKVADQLRPVNDWIDGLKDHGYSEHEIEMLRHDLYLATGRRDALNSEIEQQFLKPLMAKLVALSKKYNKDELTIKRLVGYWASTRYAIEKNNEILARERKAMLEAKAERSLAQNEWAKDPTNPDLIKAVEDADKVYRKANRTYRRRKHDVESIDPDVEFKIGTAGGWSNANAKIIMDNIEKHISRVDLEEAVRHLYRLNQHRLVLDHASGRYTEEQYREFKKNPHYVPLTGDPNAQEDFDGISGAGQTAVNISRDRQLKGRKMSEAEDGIDASWRAIGKTTTYSGWAEFKNRIDDIYQEKLDELVQINHLAEKSAREQLEKTLGLSKKRLGGTTRSSDNVLIRKQGGEYFEYGLPPAVIQAIQRENVEQSNSFMRAVSKPLGWFARGVTQWNITFAPVNMMRDVWEKSEFIRIQKVFDKNGNLLDSQQMDKIARTFLNNAVNPSKGIWQATKRFGFNQTLRDSQPSEKLLKDMLAQGALSTYRTYLETTEKDLVKKLQKENSVVSKKLLQAGEVIAGYNKIFDTVSSLASYQALIEHGVDPKQAAGITLELTNFRKTGSVMPFFKALYAFAQPTAMGGRNMMKYLSTPKGQKRFLGYMAVMMPLYMMLRALWDDDEGGNELDKQGDITRYIPIPLPGEKILKIPVGFGMPQLAWNFATNMVKAAVSDISVSEAAVNMFVQSTKSIAPIAPSEISAGKYPLEKAALTFTPTLLQPIAQITLNRNAFGNSITTEYVNKDKLKAEQAKSTTADFWQDLALGIHDTIGVDMHPEQVKNVFDGYSGFVGSLKELSTMFIENPNREKHGLDTRIPFINQLIGTPNQFANASRYYESIHEAANVAREYNSRKERGKLDGWLTDERKDIVTFYELDKKRSAQIRSQKAQLTKALRAGRLSQEAYEQRLRDYHQHSDEYQRVMLNRWRKMQGLNTAE